MAKWGFVYLRNWITVDEDLPNFFDSLRFSSAQELIKDTFNMINKYGFAYTDPKAILALKKVTIPSK